VNNELLVNTKVYTSRRMELVPRLYSLH